MFTKHVFNQLLRFGVVGIAATLVHVVVGLTLEGIVGLSAFISNIFAFLVAFAVSYSGQRTWTFQHTGAHRDALPKFFATAITGLLINQFIVYLVVNISERSYELALVIIISTVPIVCYLLNRFWVFKHS